MTRNQVAIAELPVRAGRPLDAHVDGHPHGERWARRSSFTNFEGGAIWHTITSCKFPCLGPTGAAFPIADGRTSKKRKLDFDSSEVGFGTPAIGPATNKLNWSIDVTKEEGYKPGEVVTYFCRIHPFMRGAFEVGE